MTTATAPRLIGKSFVILGYAVLILLAPLVPVAIVTLGVDPLLMTGVSLCLAAVILAAILVGDALAHRTERDRRRNITGPATARHASPRHQRSAQRPPERRRADSQAVRTLAQPR